MLSFCRSTAPFAAEGVEYVVDAGFQERHVQIWQGFPHEGLEADVVYGCLSVHGVFVCHLGFEFVGEGGVVEEVKDVKHCFGGFAFGGSVVFHCRGHLVECVVQFSLCFAVLALQFQGNPQFLGVSSST